jgi:hypothetical protein
MFLMAWCNISKIAYQTFGSWVSIRFHFKFTIYCLELLNNIDFIQVHKLFAVAKKHIKSIEGNRIFIFENSIPIGKTYKTNIIQLLK